MNQKISFLKKTVIFAVLTALFLCAVFPLFPHAAQSKEMTEELFFELLDSFKRDVYADGSKYIDNERAYSGTECYGFANQISKYIFGSFPCYNSRGLQPNPDWTINYGSAALMDLHIGDVIRFKSRTSDHSVFVTGMDDTYVYCSDANSDYRNTVHHNSKREIKTLLTNLDKPLQVDSSCVGWVAHYKYWNDSPAGTKDPSVSFNCNGGGIECTQTATRYIVITNALYMRSGAGLGNSSVTLMPNGTYFDVLYGKETVDADGYTWAQVVEGQYSGWTAVSVAHYCKPVAPVMDTDYYADAETGDIFINGTAKKLVLTVSEDEPLPSAEQLGLSRGGCEFLGWSDEADGVPVDGNTLGEKGKGEIITLYAVWSEPETVEVTDTEPDETDTEPDETETEPEQTETEPDNTDTEPDETETEPDETETEPDDGTGEGPLNVFPIVGDANGDGDLNNKDVTALFRVISDHSAAEYDLLCDVNEDGEVNNKDVIALFKILSQ